MSKQFWECDIVLNNFNSPDYNNDCVITIVALGATRQWRSPKGQTFNYQKLSVTGENNTLVERGVELSWIEGEPAPTQDICNKPLPCRIKVANDNSQYSLNGRKYTIALGEKKQSTGGQSKGSGGGGGYQKRTPDEVRGSVRHGVVCAGINSLQLDCKTKEDCIKWTDFIMDEKA